MLRGLLVATPTPSQGRLKEADERLAQVQGELATACALESRLRQRLVGGKTAAEVRRPLGCGPGLPGAVAIPHVTP